MKLSTSTFRIQHGNNDPVLLDAVVGLVCERHQLFEHIIRLESQIADEKRRADDLAEEVEALNAQLPQQNNEVKP